MKLDLKTIVYNAILAALYVVITLASYPLSYLSLQFRISEILVLLCFFRKDYTFGVTLGTVIVNLFSPMGPIDAVFGGLATLVACIGICFCKHLFVAALIPVVVNGFVVGFELFQFLDAPFWASAGSVALGELAVMVVGYIFFIAIKKNTNLFELIRRNQNESFKF